MALRLCGPRVLGGSHRAWAFEEQEARLSVPQAAIVEGEGNGTATPFDLETFIARRRGTGAIAQ